MANPPAKLVEFERLLTAKPTLKKASRKGFIASRIEDRRALPAPRRNRPEAELLHSRGDPKIEDYYQHTLAMLEQSYLEADARGDLAGGSGSGGGIARWERKRRVLAQAFERDGTWLDVGCANGLLMETLARWTAEKGVRIEPHGLDLSSRLADAARKRLPHWADRIWPGNVMTWEPPMQFDYVTVIADCAPPARRRDLVERVISRFLNPRGRMIFSIYIPTPPERPAETPPASEVLRRFGYDVAGEAESRIEGELKVSSAWIDKS